MDQVVAQALSLFSKLQEKAAESMPQQKGLVSLPVEIGAEEDSLSAQSGGGRAA
jgi:hypothetical protein